MRFWSLILVILLALFPASAFAQFTGTPNDPLYPEQWAAQHIGAPCAWERSAGATAITVAVVDSGVDLNHPDLAGRLRSDGFNFVDGNADPSDRNGHGTHVAGIIAAALNNAEGIAGLAPEVQILPIRVMSAEGQGSDRAIAAGITYAVDQGAQVINLSIGATLLLAAPDVSSLISRAIRQALAAGVVVVVAAGNDFVPLPNAIVGENADVIVVAASDRNDVKTNFSNSGPWIDVTAPGERILSTMPTYEVYLTSNALPPEERFRNNYDTMSGSSQAAPFVAALAALILAQEPNLTPAAVVERIRAGAVDIYPNHPSYYQRLQLLGAGRIDACATLGGGPTITATPLGTLLRTNRILVIALSSGICLIGLAMAGLTVHMLQQRSTSRRSTALPAPPGQPVSPVPSPRLGDTLVAAVPAWARLQIISGPEPQRSIDLSVAEAVIGRSADGTISLPNDPTLSRRHARIVRGVRGATLEDLGSSHGTFVNGARITAPTPLRSGDTLLVGQTTIRYEQLT
jgi:thermitase